MAQDISFALITTACGLAIAVPLVIMSAGIQIRIRKLEDFVDLGLGRLFEGMQDRLRDGESPVEEPARVPKSAGSREGDWK